MPKSMRPFMILAAALLLHAAPAAARDDWKPIEPAHLALERSAIDPQADAEALFWDVHVQDETEATGLRTVFNHHVRIKVFNERGVTSQATVTIPYVTGTRISDVQGRTIKKDGSIVMLDSDAVFDRVTVKAGGVKLKNKSFAMPAVEPGSIIEYRYRERRSGAVSHYLRLYFQRDIPVQNVTYHVRPLALPGMVMRGRTFQGRPAQFLAEKNDFHSITYTNLPAFREEPHMPPEDQARLWMLVYYAPEREPKPDEFWKDHAKEYFATWKPIMKPTSEIEQAAREAIGDATEPEQKLRRLYDWCRSKIVNQWDEAAGMTEEERDKLKDNKKPADALKRGVGTAYDINMVFASLCTAAGFETRIARLADRTDVFFDPSFADGYFLRTYDVAVKVGDQWKLFDPGTSYVSFGGLRWQEEGVKALICTPGDPVWIETPVSEPGQSRALRTGDFRLDGDGTLEGDVRIEYHGHWAAAERDEWLEEAPEKREAWLKDQVVGSLSTAEVTQIQFDHGKEHDLPFVCRYHVRVPGYAQRTGKRQLVQLGYFQRGSEPLFRTSERVHPVSFSYAWSALDSVRIAIPESWELEGGDSPPPIKAEGVCRYDATVGLSADGKMIVWSRAFDFGEQGMVYFPREQYASVKKLFDLVAQRDEHSLVLRPSAVTDAK